MVKEKSQDLRCYPPAWLQILFYSLVFQLYYQWSRTKVNLFHPQFQIFRKKTKYFLHPTTFCVTSRYNNQIKDIFNSKIKTMKTTFLNGDKDLKARGLKNLRSTVKNFKFFMKHGTDEDSADDPEKWNKLNEKLTGGIGSFYDYGLSIDYVAPGTFNDCEEGYLRYQLSYGGPSSEVRFYFTPGFHKAYRIEYVFLDWGTGVGFDVTGEEWAQWLFDWFDEIGTTQSEYEKALEV